MSRSTISTRLGTGCETPNVDKPFGEVSLSGYRLLLAYCATFSTSLAVTLWPAESVAASLNSVLCRGET